MNGTHIYLLHPLSSRNAWVGGCCLTPSGHWLGLLTAIVLITIEMITIKSYGYDFQISSSTSH